MRQEYLKRGIGKPDNHYVVPSGMEIDRFSLASSSGPTDWKLVIDPTTVRHKNPRFITLVSAFEKRKQHLEFLDVFKLVINKFENAVLLLCGDGEEKENIIDKINKLGIEKNVILLGYRNDIEKIISISDVCLMTSLREGLPRVIVQYAMVGRPIISTDLPGVRSIVKPEINGYLVPSKNLGQMEYYLNKILSDKELQKSLCKKMSKETMKQWSIDSMIESQEYIYSVYAKS